MKIRADMVHFNPDPDNKGVIMCNANLSRRWSCHGNHDFVRALPCRADRQICWGGCCTLWYEWIAQCMLGTLTSPTSDSKNRGLKNEGENPRGRGCATTQANHKYCN